MAEKQFEDDDPMVLTAVGVPCGDAAEAAEAFIHEFLGLGLSDGELLELFKNPFYRGTHRIYQEKGERFVTALIARMRKRWRLVTGRENADSEVEQ